MKPTRIIRSLLQILLIVVYVASFMFGLSWCLAIPREEAIAKTKLVIPESWAVVFMNHGPTEWKWGLARDHIVAVVCVFLVGILALVGLWLTDIRSVAETILSKHRRLDIHLFGRRDPPK